MKIVLFSTDILERDRLTVFRNKNQGNKLLTEMVQEICKKTLRILIPEYDQPDQWNALLLTGIPLV